MADGKLIEVISKQAFDEMQKFIKELTKALDLTIEWEKKLKGVKAPSGVKRYYNETASAIKGVSKATTDYEKQVRKLENAEKAQFQSMTKGNEALIKRRFETQQNNKAAKEQAILTSKLSTLYQKEQVKLTQLSRKYADLALKKEKNGKLSREEERLLKKTKIALDKKDRALKKVDSQLGKNNRHVGNYSRGLKGLATGFRTLATAFGIFGALEITREIFRITKELDGLNKALLKVTGSQEAFQESQVFIIDLAEQAGVEITSLQKAYTKFYASAKTTNLTLAETRDIFKSTTLAGAALGLSTDDVNGALKALEQILSKGNVQAEEIRGQLGERLPGAFQILAQSMGLTTAELNKQLQLGNVISDEVLPKFAEELNKVYGLDTIGNIQTVIAEQNRLSNTWTKFILGIEEGEGVLSKFFVTAIGGLTNIIDTLNKFNTTQEKAFEVAEARGYQEAIANIEKAAENRGITEKELAEAELENVRKRISGIKAQFDEEKKLNDLLLERTNVVERRAGVSSDAKRYKESVIRLRELNELLGKKNGLEKALIDTINGTVKATKEKEDVEKKGAKTLKDLRVIIKGSIADYENQIKKLKELRDTTATTSEAYIAFTEDINDLQDEIDKLNKGLEKHVDLLEAVEAAQAFVAQGTQQAANAPKKDGGQNEQAQDRGKANLKGLTEEEIEILKGSIQGLADTLGISTDTVNSFFEAFEDGTITAAEAMQSFGMLAIDVINGIAEAQNRRIDEQIENLQTEKDIALQFAGESAAARGNIEEQFAAKKARLQRKQAQNEKQAAILASVIHTASAVVEALPNIPLSVAVGLIGLANTAIIASQPIPKFKDGHLQGTHEGLAVINDAKGSNYRELVERKGGGLEIHSGRDSLIHMNKGDKIHKAGSFETELNGMLGDMGINPVGNSLFRNIPNNITLNGNNLTPEDIERSMKNALKGRPSNVTIIDKNGANTYYQNQHTKTNILNNYVHFKGENV